MPDIKFFKDDSKLLDLLNKKILVDKKNTAAEIQDILYGKSYHSSIATHCEKRIICRILDKSSVINEGLILQAEYNNRLKLKWANFFKYDDSIEIVQENEPCTDCKNNLVGTIDLVVKIQNTFVVFDFKSVNSDVFTKVVNNGPLKSDVVETMLNLWMVDLKNGVVLYEDRTNMESKYFHIRTYNPILNSIFDKCAKMDKCVIQDSIPEKPYKEESSECKICNFKNDCWTQKEK